VDVLPGAVGFDPGAGIADPCFASRVVWFDALVQNVDRTWRNPTLGPVRSGLTAGLSAELRVR
jgi:hypothetical protein